MFPLSLGYYRNITNRAIGILISYITTLFAVSIPFLAVRRMEHIERNLKLQLFISTLLATPAVYALCAMVLPSRFCVDVMDVAAEIGGTVTMCRKYSSGMKAFWCVFSGLWYYMHLY